MTPRALLDAFDTIAEAPDGIPRLRDLVLQLAVRGKLVRQDPADEPATDLLERIAKKRRLTKPIPQGVAGLEVPGGWCAIRFGDAFLDIFTGPFGTSLKKAEYVPSGTPVINPQNMKSGGILPTGSTCVGEATLRRLANFRVATRDLVVARRGEMGRCAAITARENGWLCGTGSLVLRPPPEVDTHFTALFLRCPSTVARLVGDAVGATMSNLNQRIMMSLSFGMPPLAEQHRIVARVDGVMGLLDRLEAARRTRDGTRAALRDAALVALREAATPEDLQVAWNRVAERMDILFTDPADVAPLRQTVLDLAVRGRLVPQNPADESASILLGRVADDQARLVREGKLRKLKALPLVSEDDVPFEVPAGWTWARFGSLLTDGPTNGWSPKSTEVATSVRTLKLSATTQGVFDGRQFKYVDVALPDEDPLWLRPGDLLIQRSNTPEYVGMAAIYDGPERSYIYPDLMMRCRVTGCMAVRFLHTGLVSASCRTWLREQASGTSQSMVKINQTKVQAALLPVPPLAEQHRIVAKVDELMRRLDQLEERLTVVRNTQAAFAAAAVHDIDVRQGPRVGLGDHPTRLQSVRSPSHGPGESIS